LARQQLAERPATIPALAPLERVSPTLGDALGRCFLRVAFAQDARFGFLRKPTIATALGIVAHEIAEAAARGRLRGLDRQQREAFFDSEWHERVEREQARLGEAWPLAPIPPPQRWRGYELVRTRLRTLLVEQEHDEIPSFDVGSRQVEAWLQDPTGRLFGRPDRVEISDDGSVEIVDLKSGWALPDEMKPEHRRQLLAYAYLWHAEHGVWPALATIQRLDGSRLTIEVNPSEALAFANELGAAVDNFNSAIADATTAEQVASPAPETCNLCEFRVACGPFFSALREEWGWYRRFAFGCVVRVIPASGSAVIELAATGTNLASAPETVRVLGVPHDCTPPEGSTIAIANAIPARTVSDIRLAWDSEILVWP
jgi:PD-(D/E)XK nuclease superfamily